MWVQGLNIMNRLILCNRHVWCCLIFVTISIWIFCLSCQNIDTLALLCNLRSFCQKTLCNIDKHVLQLTGIDFSAFLFLLLNFTYYFSIFGHFSIFSSKPQCSAFISMRISSNTPYMTSWPRRHKYHHVWRPFYDNLSSSTQLYLPPALFRISCSFCGKTLCIINEHHFNSNSVNCAKLLCSAVWSFNHALAIGTEPEIERSCAWLLEDVYARVLALVVATGISGPKFAGSYSSQASPVWILPSAFILTTDCMSLVLRSVAMSLKEQLWRDVRLSLSWLAKYKIQ